MELITENFKITCDENCFTLYKANTVKESRFTKEENVGKLKYDFCGYYTDFSQLVRGSIKHGIKDASVKDFERLESMIESIADEFRGIKSKLVMKDA